MNNPRMKCLICGKDIKNNNYVQCVECGVYMHRGCIDEEILTDVEGNYLCPVCAARTALDWFDNIISLYAHSIKDNNKEEIIERLKNYIKILETS